MVEYINVNGYEVLTPDGFKDFDGITVSSGQTIILECINGQSIECTPDHEIFTGHEWILAGDFIIGDYFDTENGLVEIINIQITPDEQPVYDLLNVRDTHSFYANGIHVHNCIMLDEFAHIKGKVGEEFFESVYPTISSGQNSKIIMVSTPNGMNLFYKLWTESEEGLNTYARVEVHWSQVPGRDEAWRRETIANTSQRQFDQEQETLFLGSTNTLITGHKLRQLAYRNPIRELTTPHTDEKVQVYYEPEEGHVYVGIVDVSEGVGLDAAAISIFDVTEFPYVQVACYASKHISELLLPDVIRAMAVFYNEAMILIENNTGREVANTLEIDLEYENIVNVGSDKRLGQIAGGGIGKSIQNGVKMSKSVKRIGCTTLKTLIEDDKLIVNDFDTIHEMMNFVETKGSFAADADGHDDRVITCVLFAWLSVQEYFKEISDLDVRAKMLAERAKQAELEVLPFFNGTHDETKQPYKDPDGTIWKPVENVGDKSHAFEDGWGEF